MGAFALGCIFRAYSALSRISPVSSAPADDTQGHDEHRMRACSRTARDLGRASCCDVCLVCWLALAYLGTGGSRRNTAASRDLCASVKLGTMPRLRRSDYLDTRTAHDVHGGKTLYRPHNLASDAVPPTVCGTDRWDRFRTVSRSLFRDRPFATCVELAAVCCAWTVSRLWCAYRQ